VEEASKDKALHFDVLRQRKTHHYHGGSALKK